MHIIQLQETESSCEQPSLLTELSLDAFDSGRSDNGIDDGHSPFIPMSDERPVLEPAVMWGALPDNVSLARPQPSESQATSPAPALQRLLAAPTTGPPPQDLITNIYSDQGIYKKITKLKLYFFGQQYIWQFSFRFNTV
jgi:hypothetical protein